MKNLFEVLRDKENQLKELHAEIKRVEDQIEKLRAAASILSDDVESASQITGAPAPQRVTEERVSEESAAAAGSNAPTSTGAPKSTTKRWLP